MGRGHCQDVKGTEGQTDHLFGHGVMLILKLNVVFFSDWILPKLFEGTDLAGKAPSPPTPPSSLTWSWSWCSRWPWSHSDRSTNHPLACDPNFWSPPEFVLCLALTLDCCAIRSNCLWYWFDQLWTFQSAHLMGSLPVDSSISSFDQIKRRSWSEALRQLLTSQRILTVEMNLRQKRRQSRQG